VNDTIMNIYMGNYSIPLAQGPAVLFGQPWDAFLPALAGSFLGVFLGFLLNHTNQYRLNCNNRTYYKKTIRNEIDQCIIDLKKLPNASKITDNVFQGLSKNGSVRPGMIIPIPKSGILLLSTNRWTSARNSGALRFFKVNEVDKLSEAYDDIEKYNYEVNITRNGEEEVRKNPGNERIAYSWSCSVDQLEESKEKLLNKLEELKKEEWLV
jgi:hypothetical protein